MPLRPHLPLSVSRPRHLRSIHASAATLLGCALALGGCGGDGQQDADATTADAASGGLVTLTSSGGGTASGGTASGGTASGGGTSASGSGGSGGSVSDTEATRFDVGATSGVTAGTGVDTQGGSCGTAPPADATITGQVVAPNLTIPVSGALVYTTATTPDPIPNEVYCEACVELPCDVRFVLTNPDGTFSLPSPSGARYLVVQKGQFMRVTQLQVAAGSQAVGVDVTSLPERRDEANGMFVPNIAIGNGSYDRTEDALAKMGLADTTINNFNEKYVPGTESFDLWDNGETPDGSQGTFRQLLLDYERMRKYHIIFVPCSNDQFEGVLNDATAIANIQRWVAEGGKWYVADWSNEFIERPFAQYQTFFTEGGSADLLPAWDSFGTIRDTTLLAWLEALPPALKNINPVNDENTHPVIDSLPRLLTVDNFSQITAVPQVLVDDGMGGQVNVGHKVWIDGPGGGPTPTSPDQPLTVTGEYGCGKILFTSYHMAEFEDYVGLTPQELVLFYIILEIGVCQVPFEPPPPAG
jgi:hypothetical protein